MGNLLKTKKIDVNDLSSKLRSHNWLLGAIGCLVISYLLHGKTFWGAHFIEKMTEHIGVAILIALFVGWTIDKMHREKMADMFKKILEEFKNNAFQAVYKWAIPKSFMQAVHDQIFSSTLIRDNWDAQYTLREFTEEERKELLQYYPEFPFERRLVMDATFDGVIKNPSAFPVKEPLTYMLEKEDAAKFNKCSLIEVSEINGSFSKTFEGKELEELLISEKNQPDEILNKLKINNGYKTSEIIFEAGRSYRITVIWKCVRSRSHAREVMSITSLTNSIKAVVYSEIEGINIYGELLSPYGFQISKQGKRCVFSSQNPNLPHQGYMIWWHSGEIDPSNDCGACSLEKEKGK